MTASAEPRIVLVCSDCDNTRILYHGIKKDIPIANIIVEQTVSRKTLIRRRIRKLGLWRVIGQLVFQGGVVPVIRLFSVSKVKRLLASRGLSTEPLPGEKVMNVPSVNEEVFRNTIKQLDPALVLVNGTRIISPATLRAITCPIINVHVGITPNYRGVHGAYWALANRDSEHCGVTVHLIDEGIDTGGILAREKINVGPGDNFITYPYLQFEKAIELVKQVVPKVLAGSHSIVAPTGSSSRLWSHPTVWQYIANRFRGVK